MTSCRVPAGHGMANKVAGKPHDCVSGCWCQGWVPAYLSMGTRGVVIDGWLGVRGSLGAWEGLRLGEWWS